MIHCVPFQFEDSIIFSISGKLVCAVSFNISLLCGLPISETPLVLCQIISFNCLPIMVSSALILFSLPRLYCNCLNISFYFTNLMFSWAYSHWDSICASEFYFGNTVFCQIISYYIGHFQLDKLCPETLIILIECARILNVMWLHLQVIRELLVFSRCNSLKVKCYIIFTERKQRELNWSSWITVGAMGLCSPFWYWTVPFQVSLHPGRGASYFQDGEYPCNLWGSSLLNLWS